MRHTEPRLSDVPLEERPPASPEQESLHTGIEISRLRRAQPSLDFYRGGNRQAHSSGPHYRGQNHSHDQRNQGRQPDELDLYLHFISTV